MALTNFFKVGLLWLSVATASAHEPPKWYASGHFPLGTVYEAAALQGLIDQPLPDPTYLIGDFIYLTQKNGQYVFSTVQPSFADPQKPEFGKLLLLVRFHGNVPSGLGIGGGIRATADEPLTLRSVSKSPSGNFLLVQAESWSRP